MIYNSGPTQELDLQPQFTADGLPKPLILVGLNGAGKTNVLSTIADAILELQVAAGFNDILPNNKMGRRLFYRLLGGSTTSLNRSFEVSVATFKHAESSFSYRAQTGPVPETVINKLETIAAFDVWNVEPAKEVIGDSAQLKNIFISDSYSFFPVNRNEDAWWQSLRMEQSEDVRFAHRVNGELAKPVVLQTSFALLKPWIADVILDQAVDASMVLTMVSQPNSGRIADLMARANQGTLTAINTVFSTILRQQVFVTRDGRGAGASKLFLRDLTGSTVLRSLDSLSTGQAALAAIFLNIIRYSDMGRPGIRLEEIAGISVIDEVDAHLHSELQTEVLPALMKLFPRVQFVATSHAPLFALGMERVYGPAGYSLVELPSGLTISPERFGEFQRSFDYFTETKAFELLMREAAVAGKRPSVICEGETDPKYLQRAAELLGFDDFAANVDFDWIGSKEGGTAKNGGAGALDNAVRLFKCNPNLVAVPLALVYDCDQPGEDYTQTNFLVMRLPRNEANTVRKGGIENLLPPHVFEEEFFETKKIERGGDDKVITTTIALRKVAFCEHICARGDVKDFAQFEPIIDRLARFFGMPRSDPRAAVEIAAVED
ncbi:AAA family ATPase [Paracidovorax citrulli]|nr:AAA family ATPase [Paracidovorax citrulli]WIY33583.1 AAA family ATPase [Paracidovorax citrulli]WIY45428.1 AAA family ATPase [Paracidovorax citrulli]WIY47679.1 AAA family ATPase [Paracidovorax citrulli]